MAPHNARHDDVRWPQAPPVGATEGGAASGRTPPANAERRPPARLPVARRPHPSRGARFVALGSSVAATVSIGAGLAYADGSHDSVAVTVAEAPATTATAAKATAAATASPEATVSTPSTATASTATAAAAAETPASPAAATPASSAPSTVPSSTTAASAPSTAEAVLPISGWADGTFTGTAEYTRWGDVQVSVTIQGGQIVAVTELQSPSDGKSRAINSRAIPVLEQEAIAAQGSDLAAVSGATYTSRTYMASLQAALDQAAAAVATAG